MQVRVRLFAGLVRHLAEARSSSWPQALRSGTPFELALPEGSTLTELVDHLGLPASDVKVIFVNGRARGRDHILIAGDEVGVFPTIGGG